MKRIAQLLLVALVVVCCSANNTDVCLNPNNPSYNNLIQFKLVEVTTTFLELPIGRDLNLTCSDSCWVLEWDELDIFQRTSSTPIKLLNQLIYSCTSILTDLFDDHFFAKLSGALYYTCGNNKKRYELDAFQRSDQAKVQVRSNQIESASIHELNLRGEYRSLFWFWHSFWWHVSSWWNCNVKVHQTWIRIVKSTNLKKNNTIDGLIENIEFN